MQTITFHTEFDVEDFVTELWAKFGRWAEDLETNGPFVAQVQSEYDSFEPCVGSTPVAFDPSDPSTPSF